MLPARLGESMDKDEQEKINDLKYWEKVLDRDDLVKEFTKSPKSNKKKRKCLRCGHVFDSNGNYTCARCQKINATKGNFGEYII
jgi:uncharacterized paraquat-inducible protein A